MKLAVIISCDNNYVPLAVISLRCFQNKNPNYDMYIIGTTFTNENTSLCTRYGIKLLTIDLSKDFINIDKRPYGEKYPIECFYHLYAYKLLREYDFIITTEADIYTNKAIDFDFTCVKYIGGSYFDSVKISNFRAIMNDIKKIKGIYKNVNVHQPKILGGLKIYNVKGLNEINFYEKMIEYYQTSIKIGAQRCGDDSLIVMYQMLNDNHITLLNPNLHIIYHSFNLDSVNDVYHFHFGGPNKKYWDESNQISLIEKYFKNKMIEYIYNNFEITYIQKYVPSIYLDISECIVKFCCFDNVKNFGDILIPYFLKKYCTDYEIIHERNTYNVRVISCGSIMRLCNSKTIVYGSGIRDINQNIMKGHIKFVRGPLTRNRLREIGCYCPPEYGDPGLLLPLYYKPNIKKKFKLGIIPHYVHYGVISTQYVGAKDIIVINLINNNVEYVIDQMLSCECTISSSLHGLIVSDAYNIPNKWVIYNNNLFGDNTKFYDYFKSVNRKDIVPINCDGYKKISLEEILLQIRPVGIQYDINKLSDNMFFDRNGIKNYTKYLVTQLENQRIKK